MDHRALAEELLSPPFERPGFVAPRYDGRGIANVPAAILRAFGVTDTHPGLDEAALPPALLDGVRRIVCLIVDALGYRQLLDELAGQPNLFLGELIGRHGVLGYILYLQELGAVSEMIRLGPYAGPWSYMEAGVDSAAFQPAPSLYT